MTSPIMMNLATTIQHMVGILRCCFPLAGTAGITEVAGAGAGTGAAGMAVVDFMAAAVDETATGAGMVVAIVEPSVHTLVAATPAPSEA